MNERIRELMTEAGMSYTLDSTPTHIDENGTHTFQEINVYKNFDPEKFAELLIRECASLTLDPMQIDEAQYYHGWLDYRDKIWKHFGVGK